VEEVAALVKPKRAVRKPQFEVGDRVTILRIPESLVRDLPEDEKVEMKSCKGKTFKVEKVDDHGFLWFGFGTSKNLRDRTHYSGHSFCLEAKYVTRAKR
jgi:hypothetical protein